MVWFAGLMLVGAALVFEEAFIDQNELEQLSGEVRARGVESFQQAVGKGFTTTEVFVFLLYELDQPLEIHQIGENYNNLLRDIKVGDHVDVTYRKPPVSGENATVYELILGEEVLVKESTVRLKRLIVFLLALLGAVVVTFIGVRRDRHLARMEKSRKLHL